MLFVDRINFVLKSQHKFILSKLIGEISKITQITAFGKNHGKRRKSRKSRLHSPDDVKFPDYSLTFP